MKSVSLRDLITHRWQGSLGNDRKQIYKRSEKRADSRSCQRGRVVLEARFFYNSCRMVDIKQHGYSENGLNI
ncbi:MAG TPA: hypothetical protein PKH33_15445 [bacterium]|nr:hypothetical protein [bacterium]